MAQYKNFEFDDHLVRLIRHMTTVEEYREVLQNLQTVWDNLTLLGQLSGTGMDMSGTRKAFHDLSNSLLNQLGAETLRKSVLEMKSRAQVAIDILIRNLFERTADIGFLATDDDVRHFLMHRGRSDAGEAEAGQDPAVERLRVRFAEYVAKYSVYHDIVLLGIDGQVLARLDDTIDVPVSRAELVATSVRSTAPYVETYGPCDLLPGVRDALIYSSKVTSAGGQLLGVLCLCFRFEDEMAKIFAHLATDDEWGVIALLDAEQRVVASSDAYHVPTGARVPAVAGANHQVLRFAGREYLATVRATQGYQGYMGPGWSGCVMLPIQHAFDKAAAGMLEGVPQETLDAVMANPSLFSEALRSIPALADGIQRDLNRAVWNGNVRQNSGLSTAQNPAFSKILLWEISNTGARTKDVFQRSIGNLHETVVSAILQDSAFLASLAIDIMDRNLYERANDCRWWALTTAFRQMLDSSDRGPQTTARIGQILDYVNGLYTVYSNLIVFDEAGVVIGVSKPEAADLVGRQIDEPWCARVLALKDSQGYAVSDFAATPLYGGRHTYIYGAAIRAPGSSRVVGGIGIVFDSTPQFEAMLRDALPRDESGEPSQGAFAVFADQRGTVVACSDQRFAPGATLPVELRPVLAGGAVSGICTWEGCHYAVGVRLSEGYREYKGPGDAYRNEVSAFVFVRLGSSELRLEEAQVAMPKIPVERTAGASVEIATFRIGTTWVGLPARDIVEAVEASQLTQPPSSGPNFACYLGYQGKPVPVFDIGALIGGPVGQANRQALVLRTPDRTTFAIAADELGEIPEVALARLTPMPEVMSARHPLTQSVITAEVPGGTRLVQVLSIDRIVACLVSDTPLPEDAHSTEALAALA